jgi:myo-inositol catabolism protein IolC
MNLECDKPLYVQPFDHRGLIGFAVGRTVFWEPLVGWRDKKTTREEAVAEIARRYRGFVDVFENAQQSALKKGTL